MVCLSWCAAPPLGIGRVPPLAHTGEAHAVYAAAVDAATSSTLLLADLSPPLSDLLPPFLCVSAALGLLYLYVLIKLRNEIL